MDPVGRPDMTRCPDCGARNPGGAAWCGQCLQPFGGGPAPVPSAASPVAPEGLVGAPEGLVGAPETLAGTAQPEATSRGPSGAAALALSALLPGAGHLAHGHYGSGIARGLLFVLWLMSGLTITSAYAPRGLAVGVPLLLGALVLWLTSLVDVLLLRAGGRQIVDGRFLLWLVVGVTGLTMLGAVGALTTVVSGA